MAKIGFGLASTIWCCRGGSGTSTNIFIALKIYAHDLVAEDEIDDGTSIYKHLSTAVDPDYPGRAYMRTI